MKHTKKIFAFLLATVMVASNLYLFGQKAEAAGDIMVFVNNQLVSFDDVEPQNIAGRVMVPVRALADAIGAKTEWNEDEKKVTLVSGDRYAVLKIGLSVMTYGTVTNDASGSPTPATTEQYELDSPPVIIDSRSLFPTRAIAEAFGAEVKWAEQSQSVFITTYAPRPAEMSSSAPAAKPASSAGPANPVFADTAYFQEVSATRLETMHANKQKFAVVIYDGTDSAAIAAMPMVTRAAADATYKIYGFDTTSTRFPNPDNLKWAWNVASKTSTDYPIIILSYEGQLDELLPSTISESDLTAKLANLKTDFPLLNASASPSPAPTPSGYWASASPSPSPSSSGYGNYKWESLSPANARTKIDNRDRFIYVVYNDSDRNEHRDYTDAVRQAAQNIGVPIFYYDISNAGRTDTDTIEEIYGRNITLPNPAIMCIKDYGLYFKIDRTTDVSSLESEFDRFINKS